MLGSNPWFELNLRVLMCFCLCAELYEIFLSRAKEKWRSYSETSSVNDSESGTTATLGKLCRWNVTTNQKFNTLICSAVRWRGVSGWQGVQSGPHQTGHLQNLPPSLHLPEGNTDFNSSFVLHQLVKVLSHSSLPVSLINLVLLCRVVLTMTSSTACSGPTPVTDLTSAMWVLLFSCSELTLSSMRFVVSPGRPLPSLHGPLGIYIYKILLLCWRLQQNLSSHFGTYCTFS